MKARTIKLIWRDLSGPTGPKNADDFYKKQEVLQEYASAILAAKDRRRIKAIGSKYLRLAAEGEMKKEEFIGFLHNAACYENWNT
jgi:hypothetical protein